VDLARFTFGSLYFSGTRFETFGGPQFLRIVNDYYMRFIRAGWAAPLAFVLDVSAMLLFPGVAFANRWKQANVPQYLTELAVDYYRMLRNMRRNPLFRHVERLVSGSASRQRRDATIREFLRFLLAEFSEFREIVSFADRRLVVHNCRPTAGAIRNLFMTVGDRKMINQQFPFVSPERILAEPLVAVLAQMMRRVTDYYSAHPLQEFVSPEELFMIDYAARSDSSVARLDYHLLCRVLAGEEIEEPEQWPPLSSLVEEVVPTESYQQDGKIGGYVDVNRKRLSESVSEVLPSEFALKDYPEALYYKMINEGLLHYIREDIERIEPELRVLFYFIVDSSQYMLQAAEGIHEGLPRGLTAWVRAKALLVDMLRDVARFFPRKNVRADVVIYLWSPESPAGGSHYRNVFDLFEWDAEHCADRYAFVTDMAEMSPAYFHYQLHAGDQPASVRLDENPYRNFRRMCEDCRYHCRHLVLFTAAGNGAGFLPGSDPGLISHDYSRDSIWIVHPETSRRTVGIARPITVSGAAGTGALGGRGRLTEDRLRCQFLEAVLLKAAARRPRRVAMGEFADVGEAEHG